MADDNKSIISGDSLYSNIDYNSIDSVLNNTVSVGISSQDIKNNPTTTKQIEEHITRVVDDLERKYIEKKNYVSDDSFRKNAERIVDKALTNYKEILKNNTEQKSEIESYKKKVIEEYLQKYKNDVIVSKSETVKTSKSSINRDKLGEYSYDYDPIVEDGKSYIVVANNTTETMQDGSERLTQKVENRVPASIYHSTNNSYSGADMVCAISFNTNSGRKIQSTLGTLQTISYSIYQAKQPVRVLGNMNAKDWVFGSRTIAGSLVFAVFNTHWLIDLYEQLYNDADMKGWHFIADEIPPFDITITFANEYGFDSKMVIYGVRLMNEGQTMSTNDIYIENTYQFVANDINLMDKLSAYQRGESKIHSPVGTVTVQNAKMKDRAPYNPPSEKDNNGGENSSSQKEETIENAVNNLRYTQDMWNKDVLENDMDLDKARKAAKDNLKKKYEEYKEKFTSKEDQNKLKDAYNNAIKAVDDFYKRTQSGEIKISAEYSQAQYPEQIKLFLGYSEEKYNEFFKQGGALTKAVELYKKYLDEQMDKVKLRVETKIYNLKDQAYATTVYNETNKILDNKLKGSAQDASNKEEINQTFKISETTWKQYKEKYKNEKLDPLFKAYNAMKEDIESLLTSIKNNSKYTANDIAYATEVKKEAILKLNQFYAQDNEAF